MIKEKTIPKTHRLSLATIDVLDGLHKKLEEIKKKKGDRTRTEKTLILTECIHRGAPLVEQELDKIAEKLKK